MCELYNTTTPLPHGCIKATFPIVESEQSPFCSTLPLLFCAIVAVEEGEVDRHHVLKVVFHEFRECEAQTKVSLGKEHIRRRDTGVCMAFEYHVGGYLGTLWWWEMNKWHRTLARMSRGWMMFPGSFRNFA